MAALADLERLVAFPTVSNRPVTELAAFLASRLEDLGFQVERFDDPDDEGKTNVVASIGPQGTDGLVLSGHMDVVPTEGQPWSSDPFALTEREGQLYGRGTADMKGFLAATLEALDRVPRTALARELVLVWTHDEEVGCLGSQKLTDRLLRDGRTLPSACLIGEPTDFQILRMHPGHVAFSIEVEGAAAHSSRPELGTNAIEIAGSVVREVAEIGRALAAEHHPRPGLDRPWVALNIAQIVGGSAINIVPDRCRVDVGYRPLPGMRDEDVFERIRDHLATHPHARRITPRLERVSPGLLTAPGTDLERILLPHAATHVLGAASFCTDGGHLQRLGAAPLVFGPGSIAVAHQADEYIPRSDLVRAVDVVESIVRERCCRV